MTKTQTSTRIKLHGPEAFAAMRKAGQLTAKALDEVTPLVKPGVTTETIDQFFMAFAAKHKVLPATLNYRGYRKACCTSVNDVVCHGIPSERALKIGDIVNIDVTYIVDGWHGDASRMYAVGQIKEFAQNLVNVTYECLGRGIETVKHGSYLGEIGHAIQTYAEAQQFSVVRDFCGHGIGKVFHDHPNVLHYGKAKDQRKLDDDVLLMSGMIFTIEPMINLGKPHVKILSDGWTARTRDGKLSAQFEHTIGVTETSCEIFTRSPAGLDNPTAKI